MNNIEFTFKNVLLKGVVLERSAFFVKVQLISPFEAWENYYMISGMCRSTPNRFNTKRGDSAIRELLIISYKKMERLSNHIDSISNNYINLQRELKLLNEISDIEIGDKMKSKLEDWFFNEIFVSSVTGIITTYRDRPYIFEIIENHLEQNENKNKWRVYRNGEFIGNRIYKNKS